MVTAVAKVGTWLRSLADRYPASKPFISRGWSTYEQLTFRYNIWKNYRAHSAELAPINLYRLLDFSPQHIEKHSPGGFDFLRDTGRIVDGEWDRRETSTIEDRFRYRSFHKRFIEGRPWEETEFYSRKVEKIRGDQRAKYSSVTVFERKCSELDDLYETIRKEGYRTQAKIAEGDGLFGSIPGDGGRGLPGESKSLIRHEIAVDLDRNGELLLNEGRHRTCIVKLLGMNSVPVRVVVRHRKWQDLRNRIASFLSKHQFSSRSEAVEAINEEIIGDHVVLGVEHPDIQSVIDAYYPSK